MMPKKILRTIAPLFVGSSLVFSNAALAEVSPKRGSKDHRVTFTTYTPGQVYRLNLRLKRTTLVELGKGEKIRNVGAGDAESFTFDELAGRNVFLVKPLIEGASTNVIVETDQRFYILQIQESSKLAPVYSVKFNVPGSAKAKKKKTPVPAALRMTYSVSKRTKDTAFSPVSIWDDGRKTYFRFAPDAPIPVVFRANDKGAEYTTNSKTEGTTVTVPSLSERWVLRHGDKYICINGKRPGAK